MKTNKTKKVMKIHQYEIEELAACICGLDYDNVDYSEIDEKLYEKFNIDIDSFADLIHVIVPMIDVGKSPITNVLYKGFSKIEENNMTRWILRVEL